LRAVPLVYPSFDGVPGYFCGSARLEFQMLRLMRHLPSLCFS